MPPNHVIVLIDIIRVCALKFRQRVSLVNDSKMLENERTGNAKSIEIEQSRCASVRFRQALELE